MSKMMVIVAVAMLAVVCQGTVVHSGTQDANNVDCSYAQIVMRKAEIDQTKLSDDEQRMLEVAKVHCSTFEEGKLTRQVAFSTPPVALFGPRPPPRFIEQPFVPAPVTPPFMCPCKCADKSWAIHECSGLSRRCRVTKMMCPHGKWQCCGGGD